MPPRKKYYVTYKQNSQDLPLLDNTMRLVKYQKQFNKQGQKRNQYVTMPAAGIRKQAMKQI